MKNNTAVPVIHPDKAISLPGLFLQRVKQNPDKIAYQYYHQEKEQWLSLSWSEAYSEMQRWQSLFQSMFQSQGLQAGDAMAIMLHNCPDWVFAEQAALSLGMVVVPLYPNDRAKNIAYILHDANIKMLIIENAEQVQSLSAIEEQLNKLEALVVLTEVKKTPYFINEIPDSVPHSIPYSELTNFPSPDDLATIVYTSGTTGKPKGVMLSHHNILFDTWAAISLVPCRSDDKFLSFLPLTHMFERTAGYYIPMMAGAEIAYARSIEDLPVDLQQVKPTVLVTVPRIFERIHQKITQQLKYKPVVLQKLFKLTVTTGWQRFLYQQHKRNWFPGLLLWPLLNILVAKKVLAKLGGQLRLAISGGAPLSNDIAQFFIGLGVTITQGYGMTEAGPVISTNKLEDNDPFSVGQILPGISTRFNEQGELLIKAENVMPGYWNNPSASKKIIDAQGWLHTGDKAEIRDNHLYITGRVKEILVLSNGEKVPPAELEMAICSDPIFEQAIVIGEAKPYLSAIVVLNEELWPDMADQAHINSAAEDALQNKKLRNMVKQRISGLLSSFPGYEQIRRVKLILKPWTVNNGMLTPTMKIKRNKIMENYQDDINKLYAGHV